MTAFITIVVLLTMPGNGFAQPGYKKSVSGIMACIPDSMTLSAKSIAVYIGGNFHDQKQQAFAIYKWIGKNIRYDIDSIVTNTLDESPEVISARLLKTRTGVCLNIATLYAEIANLTGIKTYVVHGYTRQNGTIDCIPHVWCISKIDSAWSVIDPTWGSMNNSFFLSSAQSMIHSHMPFDPMWQLLEHPWTYDEFEKGIYQTQSGNRPFHFTDTIAQWENSSEIDRTIALARRMKYNGTMNRFAAAKWKLTKAQIIFLNNQLSVQKYDSAGDLFKAGINLINHFVRYRNAHYNPLQDSSEYALSLEKAGIIFKQSLSLLSEIKDAEPHIMVSVYDLKDQIQGRLMILHVQQAYYSDYLMSLSRKICCINRINP